MATIESMAMRSNAAMDRIEGSLRELGLEFESFPRSHRDRDMLRVIQLEGLAELLASLNAPVLSKDAKVLFEERMAQNPVPQSRKPKR